MNFRFLIFISFLTTQINHGLKAENEKEGSSSTYSIETILSAATGSKTPFWIVSNRYGMIPLEAGNGLLRAGLFHEQKKENGLSWNTGADFIAVTPGYRNFYVHQLYIDLNYKSLSFSIGSKERYHSIVDKRLSSGDMLLSPNARPIPEANLSIPHFATVPLTKGWLQLKGDFAIAKSFDKGYLRDYTSVATKDKSYNENVLWHHKSLLFRIGDTKGRAPLFGILGLEHWAQWGGTSTDPKLGKQPQSFKDFLRIILGREGGENSTNSDKINALGNHYGSYYFALGYKLPDKGKIQAYHQHYFDDKSGSIFINKFDGLWGIELETQQYPWLKKVVVEFLTTKHQSGSMHFILFDHDKHPGRGGGADDYYNNGEYTTGVSNFNRGLGSPIMISPEYNKNGEIGFRNNRVEAWHLGAEGKISPRIDYRLLLTSMRGWGTPFIPLLDIKSSITTLAEINYRHPRLCGWQFSGSVAFDTGDMVEKNTGFSISIRKQGIIKKW